MSRCKKQYSPITGRSPRIISFGEVLFDVIEDVPYLTGSTLEDALAAGNQLAAVVAGQKGAV